MTECHEVVSMIEQLDNVIQKIEYEYNTKPGDGFLVTLKYEHAIEHIKKAKLELFMVTKRLNPSTIIGGN